MRSAKLGQPFDGVNGTVERIEMQSMLLLLCRRPGTIYTYVMFCTYITRNALYILTRYIHLDIVVYTDILQY